MFLEPPEPESLTGWLMHLILSSDISGICPEIPYSRAVLMTSKPMFEENSFFQREGDREDGTKAKDMWTLMFAGCSFFYLHQLYISGLK